MKKLLVVLLVLGMASLAQATIGFTASNINPDPGDTITIALNASETNVIGMGFDVLTDNGGEDGVSGQTCHSGWNISDPGYTGMGTGTLLGYVLCSQTGVPPTKLGGDLLYFSYVVPNVPGEDINISAGLYGGSDEAYVTILTGTVSSNVIPDSVTVHVTPEPMTMALLGLGGLVALRRRHA
jgi:hypothetical protein